MAKTRYWRCTGCDVTMKLGGPEGRSLPCPWCGSGNGFEPVIVLPAAEYERLRGIEARLKDDKLASRLYAAEITDDAFQSTWRLAEVEYSEAYRRAVLGDVEKP